MFLVTARSFLDDAWELRAGEASKAVGRRPDHLSAGCETGRRSTVELVWVVPTFADAQGFKLAIEAVEDAAVEVSIRER